MVSRDHLVPANERRCYNVTLSFIGLAHSQNDPWVSITPFWPTQETAAQNTSLPWHWRPPISTNTGCRQAGWGVNGLPSAHSHPGRLEWESCYNHDYGFVVLLSQCTLAWKRGCPIPCCMGTGFRLCVQTCSLAKQNPIEPFVVDQVTVLRWSSGQY